MAAPSQRWRRIKIIISYICCSPAVLEVLGDGLLTFQVWRLSWISGGKCFNQSFPRSRLGFVTKLHHILHSKDRHVTLPALQKTFANVFFEFGWGFGNENGGDFWQIFSDPCFHGNKASISNKTKGPAEQGAAGIFPKTLLLTRVKMVLCPFHKSHREIRTQNRPVSETKSLDDFWIPLSLPAPLFLPLIAREFLENRGNRSRVNREVQTVNSEADKEVKRGLTKAHKPWIRGKNSA